MPHPMKHAARNRQGHSSKRDILGTASNHHGKKRAHHLRTPQPCPVINSSSSNNMGSRSDFTSLESLLRDEVGYLVLYRKLQVLLSTATATMLGVCNHAFFGTKNPAFATDWPCDYHGLAAARSMFCCCQDLCPEKAPVAFGLG